jgi:hypothetical protein
MGGFGTPDVPLSRSNHPGTPYTRIGLAKPTSIGPVELPQQLRELAIPAPCKEDAGMERQECLTATLPTQANTTRANRSRDDAHVP